MVRLLRIEYNRVAYDITCRSNEKKVIIRKRFRMICRERKRLLLKVEDNRSLGSLPSRLEGRLSI